MRTKSPSSYHFSAQSEELIAALRKIPLVVGEGKLRETKSVEVLMDEIIEKYRIDCEGPEHLARERWLEVVGPAFSRKCFATKVDDEGNLVITTKHSLIRAEINFRKHQILADLRKIPGCEKVPGIKVMMA